MLNKVHADAVGGEPEQPYPIPHEVRTRPGAFGEAIYCKTWDMILDETVFVSLLADK